MMDIVMLFFCMVGFMMGAMVVLEALYEGFKGIVSDIREVFFNG